MKIDNKVLKQFLRQVNIGDSVNEVVLNFETEGLSVNQMTQDNVCLVNAKLAKSAFIQYEKLEKIAIDNLSFLIKFLDLFGDENVEIKKEENYLHIIGDSKDGEFILTSPEYVKENVKQPKLEYKNILKIDATVLKEVNKSSEVVGDNFLAIRFIIKDSNLIIETGETNKVRQTIKLKEKSENCKTTFSDMIGKCIKLLNGEIIIKLGNEIPITLEQKTDNSRVTYIIAPLISEE